MSKEQRYWLLKSEGKWYPIEQLQKEKKTPWSGVRNYQARNYMRDQMRVGDPCLFYHSGSEPKGVFGLAKVASKPYPDPTQFDRKSRYFDPKAMKAKPIWMLVDVAFVKKFKEPVTLAELKADPALEGMVVRKPIRLSIQPVSEKHFFHIAQR